VLAFGTKGETLTSKGDIFGGKCSLSDQKGEINIKEEGNRRKWTKMAKFGRFRPKTGDEFIHISAKKQARQV
jgi:hypothetical protein